MPVTLEPHALVTVERAMAYLKAAPSDTDAVTLTINEASQICEDWCQRPLKARAFSQVRANGPMSTTRWRPEKPLAYPIALEPSDTLLITIDGITQTIWREGGAGLPTEADIIATPFYLERPGGWAAAPYGIELSYTGGYEPVPGTLQMGCLYVVDRLFSRDTQKHLTEVASLGGAGGSISWTPGREFVLPGPAMDCLRLYQRTPVG